MQSIKENIDTAVVEFNYQESLKERTETLLNRMIKVERYVNRPMAALIVRMVYNTRVTPNGLTFFSFLLGLLGAFFLAQGIYIYFVLGGVMIQFSSIVDCADGMLARSKNMCSQYGSYLDIFLDRITDFAMLIGLSLGVYQASNNINLLLLGFLGAGLYLLQVNLFYLTNSYLKNEAKGQTAEARALMYLLVVILGVANLLEIGLYLLLLETTVVVTFRLIFFISLGKKKT